MSLYDAIRDATSIPALKQALRLVCERVEALEAAVTQPEPEQPKKAPSRIG